MRTKCLSLIMFLTVSQLVFADDLATLKAELEVGYNLETIKTTLEQRATKNPQEDLSLLLLDVHFQLKNFEEAVTYGKKAVAQNPRNAKARYQLAAALAKTFGKNPMKWMTGKGDYLDHLKEAIEIDPRYEPSYHALMGFYSDAPMIVGGSKPKALETAVALEAQNPLAGLIKRLELLRDFERYEEADKLASQLQTQFPQEPRAHYACGMYFQFRKQYAQAIKAFDAACQGAAYLPALYQRARTRILAETEPQQAIEDLDHYLELLEHPAAPSPAAAWWRKGKALEQLGNSVKALACYRKALSLEPDFKEAREDLDRLSKS